MALYMKAAEILDKVEQKKGAVKTLVYDSKFQVIIELMQTEPKRLLYKHQLTCLVFLSEYKAALCPRV